MSQEKLTINLEQSYCCPGIILLLSQLAPPHLFYWSKENLPIIFVCSYCCLRTLLLLSYYCPILLFNTSSLCHRCIQLSSQNKLKYCLRIILSLSYYAHHTSPLGENSYKLRTILLLSWNYLTYVAPIQLSSVYKEKLAFILEQSFYPL